MNKTKKLTYSAFFVAVFMIVSGAVSPAPFLMPATAAWQSGDISGGVMYDLSDIYFTDLSEGTSRMQLSSVEPRVQLIEHMAVRVAFSLKAAVVLMDAHDELWEEKLGIKPITGVYGIPWLNLDDPAQLSLFSFEEKTNSFKFMQTGVNDSDGAIGSNTTMGEDSYDAKVNYRNFDAPYRAGNVTEFEHYNTLYSEIVTELTASTESETDFKETGDVVLTCGVDNADDEAKIVMKKQISLIKGIPTSYVYINNYTLTAAYTETTMSKSLGDKIIDAWENTRSTSANYLANFRIRTPLKLSRYTTGKKMTTFAQTMGLVRSAPKRSFDIQEGRSQTTNALAFKGVVPTGTTSSQVGLDEKQRTMWNNATDLLKVLWEGKWQIIKHPIAFFNMLPKQQKIMIIILLVVAFLIITTIAILLIKKLRSRVKKR
jgi:hypothetical protein